MQKTQLMNNQQYTTYFPCCFVLMPRCLTFLSSISLWFFPRFYCPNILSFQIILMGDNTVPPNSPVVLCWCHHMELFYLLYRYGFFQDFIVLPLHPCNSVWWTNPECTNHFSWIAVVYPNTRSCFICFIAMIWPFLRMDHLDSVSLFKHRRDRISPLSKCSSILLDSHGLKGETIY